MFDTSALFSRLVRLLFDLCLFRSAQPLERRISLNIAMENTSGISEKTPSSTPSIDERDLVMSMRKLDLIKELGFVLSNHFSRY